jgi:hypothetical protein
MMTMQANRMVSGAMNRAAVEEFIDKPEVARRLKKQIRMRFARSHLSKSD